MHYYLFCTLYINNQEKRMVITSIPTVLAYQDLVSQPQVLISLILRRSLIKFISPLPAFRPGLCVRLDPGPGPGRKEYTIMLDY